MSNDRSVEIYDTTLRDGTQQEGISLTAGDKLAVASLLDQLGVAYVEGGWPGANPKDDEFFLRAKTELHLKHATLTAFGSTRRKNIRPEDDEQLAAILAAETEVVCLVGKTWDYHVEHALCTSQDEAVAMVGDSVEFLRLQGRRVFFDAEHFFDGYRTNADFALAVLGTAHEAGAERIVLCDTNGGLMPQNVQRIVGSVGEALGTATLGCHFHNDSGLAVANSITAVLEGAHQVQGCVNGYGERTGNADLCSLIPNLALKMGYATIPEESVSSLTQVSHHIAEIINLTLDPHMPYVGNSAFTHKAGMHTSGLARRRDAYEHLDPSQVGNSTRVVVSELAGRSTVLAKASASGFALTHAQAQSVVDRVKDLEHSGYQFEAADGSFELLLRQAQGWSQPFFELDSYRVCVTNQRSEVGAKATVTVHVDGEQFVKTRSGDGPVAALDNALRAALHRKYPEVDSIRLIDYRVRDLDSSDGSGARVRVLAEHSNGGQPWGTIGVHPNIIEGSWKALVEGIVIGLLRTRSDSYRPGEPHHD